MKEISLSILALAASAMIATAQSPAKFNYQGVARNSSGAALASKTLGMRITIRDGIAVGPIVFQETATVTTNAFGLYNVAIGNGTPVSGTLNSVNWAGGDKYIQVELDPSGGTSYTADLGTNQLMTVPYAMYAIGSAAPTLTLNGSSLTAGANTVTLPGGISGTQYYLPKFATATTLGNSSVYENSSAKIGIGTTSPEAKVQVESAADSMTMYVLSNYNGSGNISRNALVVENGSTSTTTSPNGIFVTSVPNLSSAVGRGVLSYGGNVGVHGIGYNNTTLSTSATFGVYGIGYSDADALGVYGAASAYSATGGSKYGVYGTAANGTTNYAGYFSGNVAVTGSISKGSGTFKIDHPLDPDNKYLYHSFVESPDMMNIYNGNITTDANGYATISMPDYFDALNKDFRYQLTAIGTFAQAIVKEELKDNQFIIQTSVPKTKVSWQVTGVRQDAYANAHRVQPEVEKEAANKGKYLHPVELGKPAEQEINYELNHPKKFREDAEAQRLAAPIHKN